MSADCCSHACNQGRDCPVRRANSFPLVTGHSLKAPPLPTLRKDQLIQLARWLALSVAAVAVVGFFIR